MVNMKRNPSILSVIILAGVLFLSACDKDGDDPADLSTIEYSLSTEDAGIFADIEYTSGFGPWSLEDEDLPWSISFKVVFKQGDALNFKAESGSQSILGRET